MKRTSRTLEEMLGPIPTNIQAEVDLSFEISDRIDALMRQRGLSKKQFADALGRRPSEITKWLSGQHNFTISTLAMISSFFGQPIITDWLKSVTNNNMASKAIKFLKEHQSETPSRFAEEAAWRKENAGWLRWSRQLAVTLIGYMQDNGLKRADLAARLGVSPQYVANSFLDRKTSVSRV